MNRTHKTIFNRRLNIWQVASEITRGASKGGDGRSSTLLALMLSLAAGSAMAQQVIDNEEVTVPGTTHPSPWNIGDLQIGTTSVGTGTLNIENGGSVNSSIGLIGSESDSTGAVIVIGTDSSWTNSGYLSVGDRGTGTLNIKNGGSVSNLDGYIGYESDSTGTVSVTGSGSSWDSRDLYVGYVGNGTLKIENGGIVSNTIGKIGAINGGTGAVVVTGTNSKWTNSSDLYVGNGGTATLNIENGGTVSSVAGFIAVNSGNGSVTVTGAGSRWENSTELRVGSGGTGILTIKDGGFASSGFTTIRDAGSTLNLDGTAGARGVLETGFVRKESGAGTGTFNWNGGILRATADQNDFLQGFDNGIAIAAGGAFVDSSGYDIGISTDLSGTGGLTKLGTGTLTLTGANGYGGTTTVSAGTLQAGTANTFSSSSAVSIATGATLDLNDLNQTIGSLAGSGNVTLDSAKLTTSGIGNTTFSGVISGTGSLMKNGTGVQTLTGASTYTGGTTINDGTLAIGANGSLAAIGEVKLAGSSTTNATFDISSAGGNQTIGGLSGGDINGTVELGGNTLTLGGGDSVGLFNGTISGTGGLVKIGSGQQNISSNSYTGNTTVSAGILHFSSYSQSANQVLGIGVRNATDYGKLTAGRANFVPDAKIFVDVTGNALASGQSLDDVIFASTQLDASTFKVTDNSALFNFEADVDLVGGKVDLNIVQASSTNSGVYDAVVAAGNSAAAAAGAAHALDAIIAAGPTGGDMDAVVTALGQLPTQGDVSRAATQTLPLLSGGVTQSTLGMLGSFNRTLQERLANLGAGTDANAGNPSGLSGGNDFANRQAWAKAFGSRADQDDRDGTSGFSAESWGMAFGADGELDRDTHIGVAYAYANSNVNGNTDLSGTQQRADVDSHLLAVYGSRSLTNAVQLNVQADIGRNSIDGTRHIDFGGLNRTASSSYASYSAHVGAGLSKTLALSEATSFAPGVRVDYTWLRDQSYRESGADALNLNVDGNTTEAFVITAEGRMRHALSDRAWLTANLGIGYDAINDRGNIVSVYAGAPGQSFTTPGIDHSPWMISGGIGYTMQINQSTQVSLRYDAEGRDDYLNQTVSVKANWQF